MKSQTTDANPYVIGSSTDTSNYSENDLCIVGVKPSGVIYLPQISSLRTGDINIFIHASGHDQIVQAQGQDVLLAAGNIRASGIIVKDHVYQFTPISKNQWFVRGDR